jgi:hypothetical protein
MRQIIVACAAVMLTLGLRASYAALHATSSAFQTGTDTCFDACDNSCMNQFSLLQRWLDFTPEFRALVVLVSSPMLMLITLWSLTSSRMVALLRGGAGQHHQPLLGPGMHSSYSPQAREGSALGFQSVHRPAARAARLAVTPIDLDNSSCTFVQTQEPESTASDSSRCRCSVVLVALHALTRMHFCNTQSASASLPYPKAMKSGCCLACTCTTRHASTLGSLKKINALSAGACSCICTIFSPPPSRTSDILWFLLLPW